MFLGRERHTGILLDEASMEQAARETLARLSVRTLKSVRQQVSSLSGGQRQTVAIAKAVLWKSKVVILDEPTAALGVAQTRQVLDLVRRLADTGHARRLHLPQHGRRLRGRPTGSPRCTWAASPRTCRSPTVDRPQVIELITAGRSGDLGLAPAARRGRGLKAMSSSTSSPAPAADAAEPSAADLHDTPAPQTGFEGDVSRRLGQRLPARLRRPGPRR